MPLRVLPAPVSDALDRLEAAGHAALLVGRCVRELLEDTPSHEFEAFCRAEPAELLRLLPSAVVTGVRLSRITLPSAAGPIDLLPLPGDDALERRLGSRDFTLHAIAYRPRGEQWIDPTAGREDLAARRLRTPGAAKERFAEDPVRALRAARLAAELGLEVDPALEAAMATVSADRLRGGRARRELELLLLAKAPERGLALLRRTGIERLVAPGVADDAAQLVARLPLDLELRLAAWLRGTRARAILRELRCPRERAVRVERILQLHPVDAGPAAAREARARRLARRPAPEREGLVALRRAELRARGESTPRSFEQLTRALERAQRAGEIARTRSGLALGGREVMEYLGRGPGAVVGRALRFLTEQVEEAPERNEPETLRALLDQWTEQERRD